MTVPRVRFGSGTLADVPREVERLSATRPFVLSGPASKATALQVRDHLGAAAVGSFHGAAPYTPADVTESAIAAVRTAAADCLVTVGGGTATGLSKAVAACTGLPQVILPTTYSGAEVTCGLECSSREESAVVPRPSTLPEAVVYDVDLTLDLPVRLTIESAMSAFAHAAEALYAPQANPVVDGLALDAIGRLTTALPELAADPRAADARTDLLYAAYLAGTCRALVEMGLQHRLCQVLGGAFGLPYAATHAVLLPYVLAYNAPAATEAMELLASAAGATGPATDVVTAPATGVYDLIAGLGAQVSLCELGMAEADLARAARLATATPCPNPRDVTLDEVEELLCAAWSGRPPVRPR